MKEWAAGLVAVSVLIMAFSGVQPSTADGPGGPEKVGAYFIEVVQDDLTEDHVSWNGSSLEVEAPELANKIRVETDYLEEEMGAWGSKQEFSTSEGVIEIDSRYATFIPLEVGQEEIFTWGHEDVFLFDERPMWVTITDLDPEGIHLSMEDGDSSGQLIKLNQDWLDSQGIRTPEVVHDDGTNITAEKGGGNNTWDFEMPHFSGADILPQWQLDLQTGVEWREMASSELVDLGYSGNESGWISKNYGSLADFKTLDDVTISFAFNGFIRDQSFSLLDVASTISGLAIIAGADTGLGLPPNSHVYTEDQDLLFGSDEGWKAYQAGDHFKAVLHANETSEKWGNPGEWSYNELYGPDDRLDVDAVDYVYTVNQECNVLLSDNGNEGCTGLDDFLSDTGVVDVTMAYLGEVEWCEATPTWKAEMKEYFATAETVFSSQTKAKPVLEWRVCTIVHEDETSDYDHGSNNWVYLHEDPDAATHPWPFNNVESHSYVDDDTGYWGAKIVVGGVSYGGTYQNPNGHNVKGLKAYVAHTIADAEDDLEWPDLAQLIHGDCWDEDCNAHAIGDMRSLIRGTHHEPLLAAHEIGHNLGGEHCDAEYLGDDEWTLMISLTSEDDACGNEDTENDERTSEISDANIDNINNHVD